MDDSPCKVQVQCKEVSANPAYALSWHCVVQAPSSWVQEHGSDAFVHPHEDTLFVGTDARGDMLPIRKLLDKYRQQRKDV